MLKSIKSKVVPFEIPKSDKEFIRYQEDKGAHFYDRLHQHPEIQLTLIKEGSGQFLSGDYVGRFEQGDVFLLGENVPHVFRSDPEYFQTGTSFQSHGLTVFFDLATLEGSIKQVEDLKGLEKLDRFSGRSFMLKGELRELIKERILDFSELKGLSRLASGLQLLELILSKDMVLEGLGADHALSNFSEKEGQRMNQVMQFIFANQSKKITLSDVASEANLSKEAFCRFFKERTRTTFSRYLNQLRIMEAKKLLEDQNMDIIEIGFQVGFENMSYFHRVFKQHTGKAPLQFRKSLR